MYRSMNHSFSFIQCIFKPLRIIRNILLVLFFFFLFCVSTTTQQNKPQKKTFKHATHTWSGVPIIAANMDTTGTFGVYRALEKQGILTALHKFYSAEDYRKAHSTVPLQPDFFLVSCGVHVHNTHSNRCWYATALLPFWIVHKRHTNTGGISLATVGLRVQEIWRRHLERVPIL